MNYFGTDGIRKVSSFFDESFLSAFCNAISSLHGVERIVIGRDTRTSGSKIERFLAEKLASHGKRVYVSGIIPSPALSYNVVKLSCDLGIMISASHNPPEDNGIKLFSRSGA